MSAINIKARDGELHLNVRIETRGPVNAAPRGGTDDDHDALKDGYC